MCGGIGRDVRTSILLALSAFGRSHSWTSGPSSLQADEDETSRERPRSEDLGQKKASEPDVRPASLSLDSLGLSQTPDKKKVQPCACPCQRISCECACVAEPDAQSVPEGAGRAGKRAGWAGYRDPRRRRGCEQPHSIRRQPLLGLEAKIASCLLLVVLQVLVVKCSRMYFEVLFVTASGSLDTKPSSLATSPAVCTNARCAWWFQCMGALM